MVLSYFLGTCSTLQAHGGLMDVYSTAGSGRVHGCCHIANPHGAAVFSRCLLDTVVSWGVHGCCNVDNPHGALTFSRYVLDSVCTWRVHGC